MTSTKKIKGVFWHHSGGTKNNPKASTLHHTAEIIDVTHKKNWPGFTSNTYKNAAKELWHVGYNFVCESTTKKIVRTRAIGEETAAAVGYNDGYVHAVITGNFDVDVWGQEQTDLVIRCWKLIKKQCPHLKPNQNWPHRKVANKTCFGSLLADDHISKIIAEYELSLVKEEVPTEEEVAEEVRQGQLKQIISLLVKYRNLLYIKATGKRYSTHEKNYA